MMLGQKPNDNLTEGYIRVSDEMRLTFYNYLELITEEKGADIGSTLLLFKGNFG